MRRPWHIWCTFGLCLAAMLAPLAWLTVMSLRMESREADALRHAAVEENVRLALWRMDSTVAPLLARESARPYFVYTSFYPIDRAYSRIPSRVNLSDIRVPSPLLTLTEPNILLHFQIGPELQITSPQVPTGNMLELVNSVRLQPEELVLASSRLNQLQKLLEPGALLTALPAEPQTSTATGPTASTASNQANPSRFTPFSQTALNTNEFQARQQNVDLSNGFFGVNDSSDYLGWHPMTALWVGENLIIARRASVEGKTYVQGFWLNWPGLRTSLLAGVKDLLPEAELVPAPSGGPADQSRLLASLPVRLVPGKLAASDDPFLTPLRISLLIAWSCLLLAAAAAVFLLAGVVSLSERRQSFVSAVTHELRTPLTTFRMYAEMLAEGMVVGEEKRLTYLRTMKEEADRLSGVVENVLAYARLERGRSASRAERITVAELLERTRAQLTQRAQQADMQLIMEGDETALSAAVHVDPAAVAQIIFNLVDNSCKYAASATDRRIHLKAELVRRHALLSVRDHGPGVSARQMRKLFRPFSKASEGAAKSAPGVGLGLALSRRLARLMGGELSFSPQTDEGACFVLRIPLVSDRPVLP